MIRPAISLLVLLATTGTSPTPYQAPCTGGYPVAVRPVGDAVLDAAYLDALARSIAYRWEVPSRRRNEFSGLNRIRARTLPPEPRWADDWAPDDSHRAAAVLVVKRDGKLRIADPAPASGDRLFDRSLRTIATDPIPGAPAPPPFPSDVRADSLAFLVTFGGDDVADAPGVVRFAASQVPVRLVPGTLEVIPRAGSKVPASQRKAVVKYDINEQGNLLPTTIEILETSDRELSDAIRNGLLRARFQPAESNCRTITLSVVQRFGN